MRISIRTTRTTTSTLEWDIRLQTGEFEMKSSAGKSVEQTLHT